MRARGVPASTWALGPPNGDGPNGERNVDGPSVDVDGRSVARKKHPKITMKRIDPHNPSNLRSSQNLVVMSESESKNDTFWYRRSPESSDGDSF